MHYRKKAVYLQSFPKESTRGVAQLASASGLGPEGPVFESQYPDTIQEQPSDSQMVALSLEKGNVPLPVPEQAPVLSVRNGKRPTKVRRTLLFLCDPVGNRTSEIFLFVIIALKCHKSHLCNTLSLYYYLQRNSSFCIQLRLSRQKVGKNI